MGNVKAAATVSTRIPPIVQMKERRRGEALFRTMGGDFLLREQFITAPSQLLAEYLGGEKVTEDAAGASDQLVYAVFSDEALLRSLREKLTRDPGLAEDQESLSATLAAAIAETGARHAVTALMRASVERQDVLARTSALSLLLKNIGGIGSIAHTEMSTGHSTGTEMSTGHLVAQTEMSTGHSTGTEMSTGHFAAHTEMSTGHSTGTEMSTGHAFGDIFAQGPLRATLIALADYSLALRRRGALDSVFVR